MVIVYGSNRKFYPRAIVAIRSCLHYNPEAKVVLLAEDDEVEGLDKRVSVIKYDKAEILKRIPEELLSDRMSEVIFLKLMIAELFPDEHRALWLDCDTIVCDGLKELEDCVIDKVCYAMVPEMTMSYKIRRNYYNAGVILFNLDLIREKNMERYLFEYLNNMHVTFYEQDALNFGAFKWIGELPVEYNVGNVTNPDFPNPKIFHYVLCDNYWTGECPRGHYWKRFM